MTRTRTSERPQHARRQMSLWLVACSLFALLGCPFWCDTTAESPFAQQVSGAVMRSSSASSREAAAPSTCGRSLVQKSAPQQNHGGFDNDEFYKSAGHRLSPPASVVVCPLLAILPANPRPVSLLGALHGRDGPDVAVLRSVLCCSSLLGRAPPLLA